MSFNYVLLAGLELLMLLGGLSWLESGEKIGSEATETHIAIKTGTGFKEIFTHINYCCSPILICSTWIPVNGSVG